MTKVHLRSLLILLICIAGACLPPGAFAQTTVKGKVVDKESGPLIGVSILVKNTTTGTVTDVDGSFSLSVPDPNATLVFSYTGFVSQEIALGGRTTLDLTMVTDNLLLNEVVVVGYGVQKKETVTGAVSSVKGSDLVKSPAVNVSNSIAGRMAGVVAVNRSGEPGYDGSGIRIRGSNTLNNNDALIVIDGIPARTGGLDRLNPNDIEKISVLKDASAAIYGARAANGVILITTKRGKVNAKPELSYSFNQGYTQATVLPAVADAAQYTEMLNDLDIYGLPANEWAAATQAYKTTGSFTRPNGQVRKAPFQPEDFVKYKDGSDPWGHPNTDWYESTIKNWSPQQRHNLQLSGGSEGLKYMASLGYQNQDGIYINSATGYKQYDLRINLDAKINEHINVSMGILGRQEYRFFPTRGAGAIFRMLIRGKPQQPAYWPDGRPGPDIENGENPVVITTNQTGYDQDKRDFIQTNGQIDIKIPGIKGLKFTGTASIDKLNTNRKLWQTPWTLYERGTGFEADGVTPKLVAAKRGPAEPNLNLYNTTQLNTLLGGVLSYEKTFGAHNLTVLAGSNRETVEGTNFQAYRRFFISPALDQLFAGGDLEKNNGGGAFERARLNYFGRVAYNFQEKYLLEFLWRYDGSDIFPEETRYGFFPGVMAGWVISSEKFMDAVPTVNYLKLRGSWGQMGNDQIFLVGTTTPATYQYLSTYGFRSYILGNVESKTLFEARIPNELITWEVANNANIGLEGAILNDKITFEFDYFNNKRTNILWTKNASVPQSTGLTLPAQNIGEVANTGFDVMVGYRTNFGKLKFNVNVNGGYAKNKILFWDEAPGAPEWQRTTGRPMNTEQVYQYDGVFATQEEINAEKLDYKAIVNTLRPGDMKYKDFNGDGKITPDDRVRTDFNNIPTFQGGLSLIASYGGFDLNVLFQGSAGAKQYVSPGEMGNIGNFLLEMYQDRWTVENPSSVHPRIANRSDQYFSGGNDYWFRSTDYIRLKNLELGFTLPEAVIKKAGMTSFRLYVNGLNLFTITEFKAFDPESSSSTGQFYPQQRVINGGVTVTF